MSQNKIAYLFVILSFLLPALLSAEPPVADQENPWAPYVTPNRQVEMTLQWMARMPDTGLSQAERAEARENMLASMRCWGDTLIGLEGEAGDRREFILQVLHFDASHTSHYEGTMVLGLFKMQKVDLPDLVAATAQFLESEDARVRTKAEEFLLAAQLADPDDVSIEQARDRPDFTVPADVFRRQREAAPRGLEPLARHMFTKDPEQALRRLADVYLDAAHRDELLVVLDGVKSGNGTELELLRKLVAPEHWWSEKWFVQLYAAEKTCSNKSLANCRALGRTGSTRCDCAGRGGSVADREGHEGLSHS